jgi:two-component system CheB/CheR fusion protein
VDQAIMCSGSTSLAFPIVGIGASAGGLAAFTAFLSGLPTDDDTGMAFVLVQHLSPDHPSLLAELLRQGTRLEVVEIDDGMPVRPERVYVVPQGRDLTLKNGTLRLVPRTPAPTQHLPIDTFFSSLADDQGERAIGVVLSGTGSDGTLGVRAIKAVGGLVMVQSAGSSEFDGMPLSALATGLCDVELPPAEMFARLSEYVRHEHGTLPRTTLLGPTDEALARIVGILHERLGHDFSQYKPTTIRRRVERRMAVHRIEQADAYVKYLAREPGEAGALFNDLLIGVTSFFRDPAAFEALERLAVPRLFEGKEAGTAVRAWSAACSTGEEAYSIAIILHERMAALGQSTALQVFATDIDRDAIAKGRAGVYSASFIADLGPERFARYFRAEPDGRSFRIEKGIRDLLIFSDHDLLRDPPFSKLDLISCRNLLIYLSADVQRKLVRLFHHALRPGGFLMLGSSEGVGEADELFTVIDRGAKLYQRRETAERLPLPSVSRALPHVTPLDAFSRTGVAKRPSSTKPSARELTEQALLLELAPPSVLVDERGDILYLHGRTGMFLEPAPGDAGVSNVLRMAREGLRSELTVALHKAARFGERVLCPGLQVKTNGHFACVDLTVRPITSGPAGALERPLYLVLLDNATEADGGPKVEVAPPARAGEGTAAAEAQAEARFVALDQELQAKDEYLQAVREELETSNEELKSHNEEMQSLNEELQSSNEELQTSREELQSVNEELATVNTELQSKVADLSQANNDMTNLLAGTGIGTVFVDHELRILRFTPAASKITNLIPTDVGRPVGQIVSNLRGYDRLLVDVQGVLDTLVAKDVEVETTDGRWYTMRLQPYRTLGNVIEGAVISFLDVTDTVRAREDLRKANDLLRLAVVVRDAVDAITVQDLEGRILAWNPGATKMYGWTEAEALRMNARDRIPEGLRAEALSRLASLGHSEVLRAIRTQRLDKAGAVVDVSVVATALVDEAGKLYGIATTERSERTEFP